MRHLFIVRIILIVPLVLGLMASSAFAQKTFNQSKAGQGGVTAGDAPGFPVTISKAGAYKLLSNLTVPNKDTTAIEITATNVTLDLNGFGIFGPGEEGAGFGIISFQSNTTVINGSVRGMGAHGILLDGPLHRVERIQSTHNGGSGFSVGQNSLVIGCTAGWNRLNGIFAAQSSVVRESTTVANGSAGILVASGSTVLGNTSRSNTGEGLNVFGVVGYAHNVFEDNNGGGQQVSGGVQMSGNVCGTKPCP